MFFEQFESKQFIPLRQSGVADHVGEHKRGEPSHLVWHGFSPSLPLDAG